jgi:purine-nucleoside phosphorylase
VTHYQQVRAAADAVRVRGEGPPRVAVILGSGLGAFADALADQTSIPYDQIPHWPGVGVAGHEGRLVLGRVNGRRVAVLAGRTHAYEGHDPLAVTFGVRVLGLLGVTVLILTNAAGGIRTGLAPGTLMIVDDHLNLTGANPLVGPNDERFGPRFPDMTEVYSRRLRDIADEAARAAGTPLLHGIYAGVLGPSYETPAEIRYLASAGADVVGMSTVLEAIAARHMGLEVLGISCVSNAAAGLTPQPLAHDDVLETARRAGSHVAALLEAIVGRLSAETDN